MVPMEFIEWTGLPRAQISTLSRTSGTRSPNSGVHYPSKIGEGTSMEWKKIPLAVIQRLVESMPRRVHAVIASRGGSTNY
ncbi:hypothetical protein CDAR_521531 [Caerostris darwini]|uniref:Uncharacterized protein n=1 Tax=Caerostris darwini TaxID=1538125 RepID=A0AAV4UE25_9ARAC|nr:hypothetical protein CDAR_521531 [Caerostris darwini]